MSAELIEAVAFLDLAIESAYDLAFSMDINPYRMMDPNGRLILLDSLTAKVNALSALAVNDARSS